jgi:hypothetical protein
MPPSLPQPSAPPPPAPQQVLDAANDAADAAADAAEQAVSSMTSTAEETADAAAREVRETTTGTAAVITRIGETLAGTILEAAQSSRIPGFISVFTSPIIAVSALILVLIIGAGASIGRFWAETWVALATTVMARVGALPVLLIAARILGEIGSTLARYASGWVPYFDVLSIVERLAVDLRGRVPGLVHPGGGAGDPERGIVTIDRVARALERLEAILRQRRADAMQAASIGAVQRVRSAVNAARAAVLAARTHAARSIDPKTAAPKIGGPLTPGSPGAGLSNLTSGVHVTPGLTTGPRGPGRT